MERGILHEQINYYRARAQEYDETTGGAEELENDTAKSPNARKPHGMRNEIL